MGEVVLDKLLFRSTDLKTGCRDLALCMALGSCCHSDHAADAGSPMAALNRAPSTPSSESELALRLWQSAAALLLGVLSSKAMRP